MSSLGTYSRSNAIPNQPICLRTQLKQNGVPFQPFDYGPVRITTKDPRDPLFNELTDVLETIPKAAITSLGNGLFQYVTAVSTITQVGTFYDVLSFVPTVGDEAWMVVNEFEVTLSGVPKLGYITVDELKAELDNPDSYTDEYLNNRIAFASRMIEQYTGRWFEGRKMTFEVDGPGAYNIMLDTPIVFLDTISLLDREFPVTNIFTYELADLVVYNRHISQKLINPDDRENPKVSNVFFPLGRMNVRLTGTFGYTDANGLTPMEIKRLTALLTIRDLEKLGSKRRKSSLLAGIMGPIKKETTDDHSYELAITDIPWSVTSYYTGDKEIDQLLQMFTRSFHVGVGLGANVVSRFDNGVEFNRFRSGFDFFLGRST